MAEENYKIDIDEGKVHIDKKWYAVDELKKSIKKKVEKEEFDIAEYAAALKHLEAALENLKEYNIKLPQELAEFIDERAKEEKDSTPGSVIREIIRKYSGGGEEESFELAEEDEEDEGEEEEGETFDEVEEEVEEDEEEDEGGEEEEGESKPVKVKCPRCGTMILVTNPARPLTITCPNCGERGVLTK